jgi:hypothetical protein
VWLNSDLSITLDGSLSHQVAPRHLAQCMAVPSSVVPPVLRRAAAFAAVLGQARNALASEAIGVHGGAQSR